MNSSLTSGNPYKLLDKAAHDASKGDAASLQVLTETIFGFPRMLSRMPEAIENPIKDRLIDAELAYRNGSLAGVREEDIVIFVNSAADKLHTPTYAKTTVQQVRVLRMQLALASPLFMGEGLTPTNLHPGESISNLMSPLQAVHLLSSLIDQKLINPDFQVEPGEWEKAHAASAMKRIRNAQQRMTSGNSPGQSRSAQLTTHKRKHDLQDALLQTSSTFSFADAMDLVDQAFKTLKINR